MPNYCEQSLFVFGAIFAALHWQFISICSCFMWLVLANFQGIVAQMRGQGTQILKVVGSILPQQKFEYFKADCYAFSSNAHFEYTKRIRTRTMSIFENRRTVQTHL